MYDTFLLHRVRTTYIRAGEGVPQVSCWYEDVRFWRKTTKHLEITENVSYFVELWL